MKKKPKLSTAVLLGGLLAAPLVLAQTTGNVIANGDFSQGAVGFTTDYSGPVSGSPGSGNGALDGGAGEGKFGIGTEPRGYHWRWINSLSDAAHPMPNGAQSAMIINGANGTQTNIVTLWQQEVPLVQGVPYAFSAAISSVLYYNQPNTLAKIIVELADTPGACAATSTFSTVTSGATVYLNASPASTAPTIYPGDVNFAGNVLPNWVMLSQSGITRGSTGSYCLRIRDTDRASGGNDFAMTALSLTAAKPAAVNDTYATPFNTPLNQTVSVGANDTSLPPNPVYTALTGTTNGTVTLKPDGTFVYTPNTGFSGADRFTYQVCAGPNNAPPCSDPATVTITVAPPVGAADDAFTTPENTPVSAAVGGNDGPLPATPVFSALTQPTNGTVALNPDGTFTYTPNNGFNGTDSFTYQVCSGPGNAAPCSSPATVTIRVGVTPVPALGLLGLLGLGAALGGVGMRRRKLK